MTRRLRETPPRWCSSHSWLERVSEDLLAPIRLPCFSLKLIACLIFCTALSQLVYAVGPSITTLSPTSGAVGALVTIAGSGFGSSQGTSTVKFSGTTATSISCWNASTICAQVPVGATTGNVVVTVSGRASNGVAFTVLPAPVITGVSPQSGPAGTLLTISGNNFGTGGGISFAGACCYSAASWSNTSITLNIPSAQTTGNVQIYASGVYSNGVPFTGYPQITSVYPNVVPVGTSVTISGYNFGNTQGSSSITFNGIPATTISSWGNGSITAAVPSGATSGNVVVTVGGVASNAATVTVYSGTPTAVNYHLHQEPGWYSGTDLLSAAAPDAPSTFVQSADLKGQNAGSLALKTFTTSSGVAGIIPTSTTITFSVWMKETAAISGIVPNFTLSYVGQGGYILTICSASGTTTLSTTLTKYQLTCSVPNAVSLTSTNPFWLYVGASWSASIKQSVQIQLYFEGTLNGNYDSQITVPEIGYPVINSISPNAGTPGTPVTVNGLFFGPTQGQSTITFNGVQAAPSSWSDQTITTAIPAGATSGPVVVAVGGNNSNSYSFTVPPPNITGLSVTSGSPGTPVTIRGQYFGQAQGTGAVTFNGALANVTSWSDTTIVTTVPVAATSGQVIVTQGGLVSNGATFTVPPVVSNVSPVLGPVGTSVTVSGSGFGALQGASAVSFNGVPAAVTSWSGTSIVAPVPPGASTGPVTVTVSGVVGNGVTFTVTPQIIRISPSSGAVGSSVNIRGYNFGSSQGSSTVTFNGVTAVPGSWADSSIAVPVPLGVTSGPVIVTVSGYASNQVNFTVAPNIASISPLSGPVGTAVTITGSNFGTTQGSSSVLFNGVPSSPSIWSATSITVPVPSGASAGSITVLVGGATSNGVTFTVPPVIAAVSPTSGIAGAPITISGSNFGAVQGGNTLQFNGVPAFTTGWSTIKIVASVPSGATSGPVVVTVNGVPSNSVSFTVGNGAIAGTVSQSGTGTSVAGAFVEALQANTTIASATTASDGSYSIAGLASGKYDLRISATGFGTVVIPANTVNGNATTTVNASLAPPSTLSGKVTQTDGITPISGAAVTASQGASSVGTATTDSFGNYSIPTLSPGAYSALASASGYGPQTQNNVNLTAGNTTTANFSLAGQSVITYTYDELGRLVGVVDSQSDAAAYHYDAVGNLLSITRNHSSQVSIIDFTPKSGPVGATVTISGTAFSTTASQNSVSFHGTSATVISATATQVVTSVPSGATSGTISVTAPAGTATSTGSFTVTAGSSGQPTIASFTPTSGVPGTAVTITGANFDGNRANDTVDFNLTWASATSATSTSISASVPSPVGSGRISVQTQYGKAISSQDFLVPFGSHVAADIGFNGRMSINATQTVSIGSAGKIGLMLFDGAAGQKISIFANNSTFSSCTLLLIDPYGRQIGSVACTGTANFLDPQTLAYTGTYTIGIDPGSSTGSVSISLNGVIDQIGTIIPGVPVAVDITAPGQNALFSFNGAAGQRVSLNVTNWTVTGCYYQGGYGAASVLNPDGSTLATVNMCSGTGFIDTVTLPINGTYFVKFDPSGTQTGTASLTLYSFTDVTGTVTANNPVNVTITYPGQNAIYTFSGTAGQRVSLNVTNWTVTGCYYQGGYGAASVLNPDGSTLATVNMCSGTGFIDTVTLPINGTYFVKFDPSGTQTGTASLTLYSFTDVTGTVTANNPVNVTITYPGQNAIYTFSGTAGQRVSLNVTNWTVTGCYYQGGYGAASVLNPDGSTLATVNMCSGTGFIDAVTLPTTGTYTVVFNPNGSETGTATLTLYLFADVTGTLTSGTPTTVNITYPGQNWIYTFSGAAGQSASVNVTNWTVTGCYYQGGYGAASILNPDGSTLATVNMCNGTGVINAVTLPTTGTYKVLFDPNGPETGTATLTLTLQ